MGREKCKRNFWIWPQAISKPTEWVLSKMILYEFCIYDLCISLIYEHIWILNGIQWSMLSDSPEENCTPNNTTHQKEKTEQRRKERQGQRSTTKHIMTVSISQRNKCFVPNLITAMWEVRISRIERERCNEKNEYFLFSFK